MLNLGFPGESQNMIAYHSVRTLPGFHPSIFRRSGTPSGRVAPPLAGMTYCQVWPHNPGIMASLAFKMVALFAVMVFSTALTLILFQS
jgi:hypothetical protein